MTLRLTPNSPASSDFRLPPLPQTLLRATELMRTPGSPEVDTVVNLVEYDPSVVARILKITNSAYYGQRAEISSVRRAVVILAPGTVVGLVMSMGMAEMKDAFDDRTMSPFLDIVRHSVATGYIAEEMTSTDSSADDDSPSEAFTAGLLHDIGKLILLYNHPGSGAELYRTTMPEELLLEEEERLFDTTHVRIGAAVAETLRLPEALKDVIRSHHATNGSASSPLVQRIQIANRIAHALGFPETVPSLYDQNQEKLLPPDVLEHWKSRQRDVAAHVDGIM